ncbi:hypothetical protein Pla123a_16280 [Posidoniimonas polymericola]|uniref:Uncharacterized protein n=1 Tax=Posidoniimonas polymericola TaxID=2528002 RepID=A0A5C5YS87_9BACT|nr:hypothetical protein Pla123a_16280 [Posidoniimonas polymericola]
MKSYGQSPIMHRGVVARKSPPVGAKWPSETWRSLPECGKRLCVSLRAWPSSVRNLLAFSVAAVVPGAVGDAAFENAYPLRVPTQRQ